MLQNHLRRFNVLIWSLNNALYLRASSINENANIDHASFDAANFCAYYFDVVYKNFKKAYFIRCTVVPINLAGQLPAF